jgi:hypothetical protein
MSTIVKFNNKILRLNNKTVGWTAPVPPPVLYHVTTNGVNGTVVATPNTGYNGDTITLSNTPDAGYEFDSYSLTGATLYDTNKFDIDNSDVNVVGNFIQSVQTEIKPWYLAEKAAYFYRTDLEYNKNYKLQSNNFPSEAAHVYCLLYDSSWSIIKETRLASVSNNFRFNLSDICTETEFNNTENFYLYFLNSSWSDFNYQMPSDIVITDA